MVIHPNKTNIIRPPANAKVLWIKEPHRIEVSAADLPFNLSAVIPEGAVTVADIARLYVYDNNTLKAVRITGQQLREFLEKSAEYYLPCPERACERVRIRDDVTTIRDRKTGADELYCGASQLEKGAHSDYRRLHPFDRFGEFSGLNGSCECRRYQGEAQAHAYLHVAILLRCN